MQVNFHSLQTGSFIKLSLFIILFLYGCSSGRVPVVDGAMFRGNPQRTGEYHVSKTTEPKEWKFQASGPVLTSPVVDHGIVYFGSQSGDFYAVDLFTGELVWQLKFINGFTSTPAVWNNVVYLGGLDGQLYALAAGSGEAIWKFPTQGPIESSPAVTDHGVYFGSGDGKFYAVSPSTGESLWTFTTGKGIVSSPLVTMSEIFFGSKNGDLYCLDIQDGSLHWKSGTSDWVNASPAFFGNTVYWGGHDGILRSTNSVTQNQRWQFETDGILMGSAAISTGVVFSGSSNGFVYAINALTGKLKWETDLGSEISSSPAISDGVLYIGSFDGRLYALDTRNGEILWCWKTGGQIYSSPSVAGNLVLAGSADGVMYALLRNDHQSSELAQVDNPETISIAVEEPANTSQSSGWWNDRIFYRVLVRSFYDTNADGIGDIQGLIQKLDYLNDADQATDVDLGVNTLLLMPLSEAASPHGYDPLDYYQLSRQLGSSTDFLFLVEEAHRRGMKIIIELPVNQTSSQNPWFVESSIPGSPYRDLFIWKGTNPGYPGPEGQQVWYENNGAYYYALRGKELPDLNLENQTLTSEIYAVTRFWTEETGVDGIWIGAAGNLIEDGVIQEHTQGSRRWLQDYLNYVHFLDPENLVAGEVPGESHQIAEYTGSYLDLAPEPNLAVAMLQSIALEDAGSIRQAQQRVLRFFPASQYLLSLTRPDQARVMTYLNENNGAAKLAATLLFANPGVPVIYFGDELGMPGQVVNGTINEPMQWAPLPDTAGFSTGTPWSAVGWTVLERTVADQIHNPASILNHYRALIQLRLKTPALRYGEMRIVESTHTSIYSYLLTHGDTSILILANLSSKPVAGYQLSLDEGALSPAISATSLFGDVVPELPTLNGVGGFSEYTPVRTLPPYAGYIIQLTP